jgi:hypothetical protein
LNTHFSDCLKLSFHGTEWFYKCEAAYVHHNGVSFLV